ncbi:unnamed protein product [Larinioides sclopetarius]|uniref:CCHC-type domain-containing protein n=1 Tax=Larinioides sclopetarius TaxID=280406 RepID=A0AAV2C0J8_9ARAC
MAFWGRALKADLQNLADCLGVEVGASATVLEIKKAIQAMPSYEEEAEYIKELLEKLKTTRLEEERKTKEAKQILEEKELENAFQLKKLQLEYKFSAEKFRQKFNNHTKSAESNWTDFLYELRNYFEEWLKGLEVKTFSDLSDLIVTEQIKRRVPWEVKEHFIDDWAEIKSPEVLARKLDEYDNVRNLWKKKSYSGSSKDRFPTWKSKSATEGKTSLPIKKEENEVKKSATNTEDFEKGKTLRCYKCGSKDHIRPNCPLLKNKESSATINRLFEAYEDEVMSPHTSMGEVNGFPMPILRDTGSSIDVVCLKVVKPKMFTGEQVWVQQPLDDAPVCLPLAEIELKGEFGHLITKAAVVNNNADKGRYLLGNRTAALLEKMKKISVSQQVNAIQTRAQKRLEGHEKEILSCHAAKVSKRGGSLYRHRRYIEGALPHRLCFERKESSSRKREKGDGVFSEDRTWIVEF